MCVSLSLSLSLILCLWLSHPHPRPRPASLSSAVLSVLSISETDGQTDRLSQFSVHTSIHYKSQTTPTPFLLRPVFCLIPRKFATSEKKKSSNPIWILIPDQSTSASTIINKIHTLFSCCFSSPLQLFTVLNFTTQSQAHRKDSSRNLKKDKGSLQAFTLVLPATFGRSELEAPPISTQAASVLAPRQGEIQ